MGGFSVSFYRNWSNRTGLSNLFKTLINNFFLYLYKERTSHFYTVNSDDPSSEYTDVDGAKSFTIFLKLWNFRFYPK